MVTYLLQIFLAFYCVLCICCASHNSSELTSLQGVVCLLLILRLALALICTLFKDPNLYNETCMGVSANNTGNGSGYSSCIKTDSCYLRDCWEDSICIVINLIITHIGLLFIWWLCGFKVAILL